MIQMPIKHYHGMQYICRTELNQLKPQQNMPAWTLEKIPRSNEWKDQKNYEEYLNNPIE